MNVAVLFDEGDDSIVNKVDMLKEYSSTDNELKKYNIKYITKITSNSKIDVYLVFADDSLQIEKYTRKVKNCNKCVIVTKNTETAHILNCINYTKYVTCQKSAPVVILDKVIKAYEKNNQE